MWKIMLISSFNFFEPVVAHSGAHETTYITVDPLKQRRQEKLNSSPDLLLSIMFMNVFLQHCS